MNVQPNLSRIFGPGSVFALDGTQHRGRRKLLAPPFHGQSIKNYEKVIEEETLRETATWQEDEEIRTLEPMNRITLNVILRTVFGADGAELDYLRERITPWAKLGSRMATLPEPPFSTGRYSPWGRLAEFRRNFDRTVFALIDKAEADPRLEERTDILALLLRSRYDDGTPMSRQDVSDELLTLWAPGMKPPRRRWVGRSSGYAAIRRPRRARQGKRRRAATNSARPPSSSCSGTGP
jgi:cytochrome P450